MEALLLGKDSAMAFVGRLWRRYWHFEEFMVYPDSHHFHRVTCNLRGEQVLVFTPTIVSLNPAIVTHALHVIRVKSISVIAKSDIVNAGCFPFAVGAIQCLRI